MKNILILLIIVLTAASAFSQSLNTICKENSSSKLFGKAKVKNNLGSVNTSFSYIFITNPSDRYTNSKGFSVDLQINQNQNISWLIGGNFNFYKEYYFRETLNVSIINIILGPKFNFSNNDLSAYYRINTGMSFFGRHGHGGIDFAVLLFHAVGAEYKISKLFKLYLEPNLNMYFSYGSFIYFRFNTGISTLF